MTTARISAALAVALLACLSCIMPCGSADAQSLSIINTSVACSTAPQARDGVTLTLGYQIASNSDASVQLTANLTAPNGQNVADLGDPANNYAPFTANVTSGTHWYYRSFLINLPPGAQTGSNVFYDITYTAKWGSNSVSYPWLDVIKMLPPVSVRLPILMYHKIGTATYSQYWNSTSMLNAQLAALKAYGYTALTSRELMDIRAGITPAPDKPMMLTFDGGYENFYQYGLPIVSSYGYKAVLFQLTGYMGMDNSWDGDNNPVIMFMTNEELTSCWNTGMLDIADHTVTHPDMTKLTSTQNIAELQTSRATILSCCPGAICDSMAYPYGYYSTTVEQAVRDANFFSGYAASGGVETNAADKYALRRIEIASSTVTDYSSGTASKFFFNLIGISIAIPTITINSVQFLDPDTGGAVTQLQWGQTVKIRVTATNSGAAADAGCSLSLTHATAGTIYDSHATSPAQDVSMAAWTGQETFDFYYTVPIDTPTGVQYSAKVYFRDKLYVLGFKAPVSYNAFTVTSNLISLTDAKSYADSTWASIKGAIVTAAFPDIFYVETPTRSMGIRVEKPSHGLNAGQIVDLAGTLINSPTTGERCLKATYLSVKPETGSVSPLALTNRAIGGGASGHQDQIWKNQSGTWVQGSGLNNTGLLVRTCGRVLSVDMAARTLIVDDGSGGGVKCVWPVGLSVDPTWTYIMITGISSCEPVSAQLHPVLLISSAQGGS